MIKLLLVLVLNKWIEEIFRSARNPVPQPLPRYSESQRPNITLKTWKDIAPFGPLCGIMTPKIQS